MCLRTSSGRNCLQKAATWEWKKVSDTTSLRCSEAPHLRTTMSIENAEQRKLIPRWTLYAWHGSDAIATLSDLVHTTPYGIVLTALC